MQYLGFGVFAVILVGVAWLFSRSMTSNERNESDRHGGGLDDWRGPPNAGGDGSDVS
jgi:hypothetical protein